MVKHKELRDGLRNLLAPLALPKASAEWFADKTSGSRRTFERWLAGQIIPRSDLWNEFVKLIREEPTYDASLLSTLSTYISFARRRKTESPGTELKSPGRGVFSQREVDPEETNEAEGSAATKDSLPSLLTPSEPDDDESSRALWNTLTSTPIHRALRDKEWAWAAQPFLNGMSVADVALVYRQMRPRYDKTLHPLVQEALSRWCAKNSKAGKLQEEPWTWQVRLTSADFDHSNYTYTICLAPTKFLYYAAIQQNLWSSDLRDLRRHAFTNAVLGLDRGEELMLPSTFATHMAVVSRDGKALLRRRSTRTPLYPGAWEAGVGEFMHGPGRTRFRHFDSKGYPKLSRFLKSAVAEELDYNKAKSGDFVVFGLAAEYRTLAPKLVVAYFSDAGIDALVEGARRAHDKANEVAAIDLTVNGVARAVTDSGFPTWGPTSKLALALALGHRSKTKGVLGRLEKQVDQLRGRGQVRV